MPALKRSSHKDALCVSHGRVIRWKGATGDSTAPHNKCMLVSTEFQMLAVLWVKQSNCQGIAFELLELFRGHKSGCRNSGLWSRRMSVLPCPQRTWGRSASQAAFSSDKNRNKSASTSVAYPWWMCTAKTGTSRNLGNSSSLPHCGKFSG